MTDRKQLPCSGLSVPELLLVTAVIAALAAVLLPHMATSLRAAREARALAQLRTLSGAQMSFCAGARRFALFGELFAGGYLPAGSFARGAGGPTGGASEAVTDGAYFYSVRFAAEAQGITLDADPVGRFAASHRRFRLRLGRVTSAAAGAEGTVFAAAPSVTSPPPDAYVPLDP